MMRKFIKIICVFFALVFFNQANAFDWGAARGFNVTPDVSDSDIEFIAGIGCNVIRVSFANEPLVQLTAPYEDDEIAFAKLDRIVKAAKRNNLAVVVDPHAVPGFKNRYTTSRDDEFWSNKSLQDRLILLWVEISKKYKNDSDVILGFDLMNEPVVPIPSAKNNYFEWNQFVAKLIASIRAESAAYYIVVEPARQPDAIGHYESFFDALKHLKLPDSRRVVVSPHMYMPLELTHEGVLPQFSQAAHYPGYIAGEQWDAQKVKDVLAVARHFGDANHVPIFIGEFSASVKSGDDGDRYIGDLISVMNHLSFGWAFHAFKENPVWNPQQNTLRMDANGRTARMNVIVRGLTTK